LSREATYLIIRPSLLSGCQEKPPTLLSGHPSYQAVKRSHPHYYQATFSLQKTIFNNSSEKHLAASFIIRGKRVPRENHLFSVSHQHKIVINSQLLGVKLASLRDERH
jgi:hypothetical protein